MDYISNFIDFMSSKDCAPASSVDIKPTDKWVDYQIAGDPNGKKKGFYILKIDGDYVSGACGDRRTGEVHQFHGKPERKLTDEERREFAKRREADRKARADEEAKRHNEVAIKAQARWKAAKQGTHSYLERKGVPSDGTRVLDGFLLIPMYGVDGKLWGLQSIDKDGGKLFQAGGRKKGCYCPIAKASDDKSVIYICEGFATGATIRAATGGVIVVAFDAGNLKPVAEAMRGKYPTARLVICADNDHGGKVNTGLVKGEDAAKAVGGIMIAPDGIEGTDWNDMQQEKGLDAVRDSVAAMVADRVGAMSSVVVDSNPDPTFSIDEPPLEWLETRPPIEAYDDEAREIIRLYDEQNDVAAVDDDAWREKLQYNDKGKLDARSLNNVQLILEFSPKFRDMFCYDEFAHEKILVQCPDWEKPEHFKPRPISDEDVTWLTMSLERNGLTLDMAKIKKILDAVILKKRRNPAKEYFNGLVWDGVPRLHKWLTYYAGCENEDETYLATVGTKWLVAAVTRVFNAGAKFDHVLIFEGAQGAGKSSLLKELSTIRGRSYFDDTIKVSDLGEDKTVPKLQGVLIIELAEMAGLRKSDVDKLKQQITISEDRLVRKYANEATRYPRQFVMAGSINPVQGYLDDPTGNRRFLPVKVGRKIDVEAIKKDKEQLWAEAVALYRKNYSLWLDDDMMNRLRQVQVSREIISPWLPDLEALARNKEFVATQHIWETLGIEKGRRTQKDSATIGKIMVSLGFKPVRKRIDGTREYGWAKEPQEVSML